MHAMQAAATRPYALLSIAAAVATIALKSGAFALTGSVGLLSDAAESLINLVAALFTFWALGFAALPPDREHPFGHTKVEYFAGGIEGALIVVAAAGIAVAAVDRFLHPQPIAHFDLGLALSLVASAINGAAAWTLIRAGKRLRALPLRADGEHLLTDV